MSMTWTSDGKVKSVFHSLAGGNGQAIDYTYDAGGNRIKKAESTTNGPILTTRTTYYVHDAVGTVVAIYEGSCEQDVLDNDADNDGVDDLVDNCPGVYNPEQHDIDADGVGNECDADDDGDGQPDTTDPYPHDPTNPTVSFDADLDGTPDVTDNCPMSYNPAQGDSDGDGIGDVCDSDRDNDGVDNSHDPCPEDKTDQCDCEFVLVEQPIYGLGRVGVSKPNIDIYTDVPETETFTRDLGEKSYELTDHLGNVKAVISDRKLAGNPGSGDYYAEFLSYTNAYPYGMPQPGRAWADSSYRYGFNGMESDDEVKLAGDHHYTTFFRQYDPRVGRWWSNDPVTFPGRSVYEAMGGNPIALQDPYGDSTSAATATAGEPREFDHDIGEGGFESILDYIESSDGTPEGEALDAAFTDFFADDEPHDPMSEESDEGEALIDIGSQLDLHILRERENKKPHIDPWPIGAEPIPAAATVPTSNEMLAYYGTSSSGIEDLQSMVYIVLSLLPITGEAVSVIELVVAIQEGDVGSATLSTLELVPAGRIAKIRRLGRAGERAGEVAKAGDATSTLMKFSDLPDSGQIDPRLVRFSQNSIGSNFKSGRPVSGLTRDLRSGKVTASDVDPIRIVEKDGLIYSLDNRRLKAFQDAGLPIQYEKLDNIPENELRKFTTKNEGVSVRVRKPRK